MKISYKRTWISFKYTEFSLLFWQVLLEEDNYHSSNRKAILIRIKHASNLKESSIRNKQQKIQLDRYCDLRYGRRRTRKIVRPQYKLTIKKLWKILTYFVWAWSQWSNPCNCFCRILEIFCHLEVDQYDFH